MCKKVSIWIYDWALSLSLSPCPLLPFNSVLPHSTRFTFAITKAINWPCEHELIKMQLNAKRLDFGFSNTTQSKREAWKRDRGRAKMNGGMSKRALCGGHCCLCSWRWLYSIWIYCWIIILITRIACGYSYTEHTHTHTHRIYVMLGTKQPMYQMPKHTH